MMDVVYILRNSGTRWMNNEIKYSIRSLEKNFDFNKLFIIGALPKFIDPLKVGFIASEDPFTNRLKNAIHKIKIACQSEDVSDNFILMNDDFFFLRKVESIEYFDKGFLEDSEENHSTKEGEYYRAIRDTLRFLQEIGIEHPIDFEVHYPMVINKKKFLETIEKVSIDRFLFRSIYGNLNNIESKQIRDVKIFDMDQLKRVKKSDIISTADKTATDIRFQKFIDKRYKQKSSFEKTPKTVYVCNSIFSYNGKRYNPGDIIIDKIPEKVIEEKKLKRIERTFY